MGMVLRHTTATTTTEMANFAFSTWGSEKESISIAWLKYAMRTNRLYANFCKNDTITC
jgi:hypothetical protein